METAVSFKIQKNMIFYLSLPSQIGLLFSMRANAAASTVGEESARSEAVGQHGSQAAAKQWDYNSKILPHRKGAYD